MPLLWLPSKRQLRHGIVHVFAFFSYSCSKIETQNSGEEFSETVRQVGEIKEQIAAMNMLLSDEREKRRVERNGVNLNEIDM